MRKATEILRLKFEAGLSHRQIGASVRLSHVAVGKYLQRAREAGIGWPLPEGTDEEQLRELLRASERPAEEARRPLPEMAYLHKELHRPGVTLQLLWEEYRRQQPQGYGYTQFCEYYRRFASQLDPVLRQSYKPGERMFVDWAGDTIPIRNGQSDGQRPAYLFVAVQGLSNYTFSRAFENMRLAAWIEGHIRAWEFFGGVNTLTVPDNPRTAVKQPCRYEPELNRSYQELAEHYGTVVVPARTYEPRDKAKVENAVQNAQRRILAPLRDQSFFSLKELNEAIGVQVAQLNERPFQKMLGSRASLFAELDRPALRPLPATPYELGIWSRAKVNLDYHIQVGWHLYSVPYRFIGRIVEVRQSAHSVEIFLGSERIAVHCRDDRRGCATTDPAHRPKAHEAHLEWTPSRMVSWARTQAGPACAELAERILTSKPHPEQGYRACLGLIRLGAQYGAQRLERACQRALAAQTESYRSVRSILLHKLDGQPLPAQEPAPPPLHHDNLRGPNHYAQQ